MKKGVAILLVMMVGLLIAAAATAGCGSTTPEQAKSQLRTDLQNLQTALQGLLSPTVYSSVDNFKAAWSEVEKAYENVISSAKEVKNVNVDNLKSAFEGVKKAVGNLGSSASLQQKAGDIADALTNLQKAWQETYASLLNTK